MVCDVSVRISACGTSRLVVNHRQNLMLMIVLFVWCSCYHYHIPDHLALINIERSPDRSRRRGSAANSDLTKV
jgi:hypothetical protein